LERAVHPHSTRVPLCMSRGEVDWHRQRDSIVGRIRVWAAKGHASLWIDILVLGVTFSLRRAGGRDGDKDTMRDRGGKRTGSSWFLGGGEKGAPWASGGV